MFLSGQGGGQGARYQQGQQGEGAEGPEGTFEAFGVRSPGVREVIPDGRPLFWRYPVDKRGPEAQIVERRLRFGTLVLLLVSSPRWEWSPLSTWNFDWAVLFWSYSFARFFLDPGSTMLIVWQPKKIKV